jgi:hypothetical protein
LVLLHKEDAKNDENNYKAPELFDREGQPVPRPADPAQDIYSFGRVLKKIAAVTEGSPKWLEQAAAACLDPDPARRPRTGNLIRRLSPDWDIQDRLIKKAGFRPEDHPDLIGRQYVFDAFAEYARGCSAVGGVFLVIGPSGVGKTALLTNWPVPGGQTLGFYFRYRDGRTQADAMVEAVAGQLRKQFPLDQERFPDRGTSPDRLEEMLRHIAESHLSRSDRVLIFVDALDEAADPGAAVRLIPRSLPRGVFVIASSRPPAQGQDHLDQFRNAHRFDLRADDDANYRALEEYFQRKLGKQAAGDQARTMAEVTGGSFMLARLIVESVQKGVLPVSDVLQKSRSWAELSAADRLFEYYRETWKRICTRENADCLTEFASLLVAAETWMSEDQARRILSWYEGERLGRQPRQWTLSRVPEVVAGLAWFLDRQPVEENGYNGYAVQLRHQSVRD